MNHRTRQSLLGYGITAELVDEIAAKGHTVSILRAMSSAQLTAVYGVAAGILADRLRRKPVTPEVIKSLEAAADGCCCFCADGNSSRPYEIHHIDEYAETQNNAPENLLLVCPTHHRTIHERQTPQEAQRERRSL